MDPWVRSRREGEVLLAVMGKDSRALLRGMRASKAGGGRQHEPEEGGQQADGWQQPVQLAKIEGSVWRRLELLDEVAGSDVGPVWKAGKSGLRDGMSAMPDDCMWNACSTRETSEGLLRALGG
jgi:hypothetical protein